MHGRVRRPDVDHRALEHLVRVLGQVELRLVDLVLGEDPAPRRVVVLAQRVALEALVAEDAPQVRVAGEAQAEHVVGLALEPVGGLPDRDQRGEHRVGLGERHLEAQARGAPHRVEVVDGVEALGAVGEVDAANVEQQVEAGLRAVAEIARERLGEDLAADDPGRLVEPLLHGDAPRRVAGGHRLVGGLLKLRGS